MKIGQPGDAPEREADAVADQVNAGNPIQGVSDLAPVVQAAPDERDAAQDAGEGSVHGALVQQPSDDATPDDGEATDGPAAGALQPLVQRQAERALSGDAERSEEPESSGEAVVGGELDAGAPAAADAEGVVQAAGRDTGALDAPGLSGLLHRSGPGEPLRRSVRERLEVSTGHDFGGVRVHEGEAAVGANQALGARAFTHGRDIWLGAGESPDDVQLMAHESTHVVQQRGLPAGLQLQGKPGDQYEPVGKLTVFDSNAAEIASWTVALTASSMASNRPKTGVYEAKITAHAKGYAISFGGYKALVSLNSAQGRAQIKQSVRAVMTVAGPRGLRKDPGTGQPGQKGGTGAQPRPGSKYGWLGLLDLPQDVIDALEGAFEALGDAEEYLALKETIQALANLAQNKDAFRELFDGDKLLIAVLGLEPNPGLDALESWAVADTVAKAPSKPAAGRKGLVKLAMRIAQLVAKVRKVLRPVFKGRRAFREMFAQVATVIQGLSLVDELVDVIQDPKRRASDEFNILVEDFSNEAAQAFQEQLEGARAAIAFQIERFEKATDLITYEEVASAVTDAALKAVPKLYRPIVWAARKLGLVDLVSDNVVTHLIPKAALDAVNGVLGEITALLAPTINRAKKDIDAVFGASEAAVREHLIPELKSALLQPSRAPGSHRPLSYSSELGASIRSSRGEPMGEDVAGPIAAEVGVDASEVTIHRDQPAATASGLLDANAFTVGRHVYFGPDRYRPDDREGRRLLAHELTHVAQQGMGEAGGVIQGDWKSVVNSLKKKFGTVAAETIRSLTRPKSKKTAEQAEAVLKKVNAIANKKVTPDGQPALPTEAYYYVRNKKGVITGIRRKPEWAGSAIPKLKIWNGRITIGTVWDWKAAARAKLRKALGEPAVSSDQAHHMIPLELASHPIVKLAVANRWNINGRDNGFYLPQVVHSSSHGNYTGMVRSELAAIQDKHGAQDWSKVRPALDALLGRLRTKLKKHRDQKKRLD